MSASKDRSRKEPVGYVVGKGHRLPIYYHPTRGYDSYRIAYYPPEEGRKFKRASTLKEIRIIGKELIEKYYSDTIESAKFSKADLVRINESIEILRPLHVPLIDAVREYVSAIRKLDGRASIYEAVSGYCEHQDRIALPPIKFPELVEKFLAHLKEQNKSTRYLADMQARLHKAAKTFTGEISYIRAIDINQWLGDMKVETRTKRNYRNSLATLFSFARSEGYLARGTHTEAEFARK